MKDLIIERVGLKVYGFLVRNVEMANLHTLVVSTSDEFNIASKTGHFSAIVNFGRVNDIRYINKFFNQVNFKLKNNDKFICCFETITTRRERQKMSMIPVLGSFFFAMEFLFLRVAPKIWGIKKIYFGITKGRNRLLSRAEVLGRLVCCGFEIMEYESFSGLTYVVCKKVKEPDFNPNVSYGPIFKMQRIGKNGRVFGVYKFRTMHPYAEYLQDYVLTLSGYSETGKPANDFRLTPWGGFLRKYWFDELPQLINVLRGEMKLVGVRPISERYFKDIPKDIQDLRLKQKPGCIPPYVSLNRKGSVAEVLRAEKEYLIEKSEHPFTTDIKYFAKGIFNIIFKGKRSA